MCFGVSVNRKHQNFHLLKFGRSCSPGGGPQSRYQSLQEPCDEDEGVLASNDKIKSGQNKNSMDHQADDDRDGIHAQLATHLGQIVHLHNLSCNQEQDANGSIPEKK